MTELLKKIPVYVVKGDVEVGLLGAQVLARRVLKRQLEKIRKRRETEGTNMLKQHLSRKLTPWCVAHGIARCHCDGGHRHVNQRATNCKQNPAVRALNRTNGGMSSAPKSQVSMRRRE